jgi:8-oxo-dGTP pyrophosphatase MutT (NUDIX family)
METTASTKIVTSASDGFKLQWKSDTDENLPEPEKWASGCAIILNRSEEVLVMERNPNYKTNIDKKHEFELPGGKRESSDRSPFNTCVREVLEEVGVDLLQDSANTACCDVMLAFTTPVCGKDMKVDLSKGEQWFYVFDGTELTQEQLAKAFSVNRRDARSKELSEQSALGLEWVSLKALLGGAQARLPLRKFNVAVLKGAEELGVFKMAFERLCSE